MEIKRNKNYIKVENKFIDSLVELLIEKGYRNVTTGDIIKKAGVKSKKTFYLHFKDKEDMFLKMEKQFLDKIVNVYHSATGPILYFTNREKFYKILSDSIKNNLSIAICFANSPFAADFIKYIADKITVIYKDNYSTGIWEHCQGPEQLFNFYHLFVSGYMLECFYAIKSKKKINFSKIEKAALAYRILDDSYCLEYYTKLSRENINFKVPDIYANYMIDIYPESKDIWEGHIVHTDIK